jgi:phenylpropionate dioxygenase-like ring-hydroxylating dioxygenase large terminal subunit
MDQEKIAWYKARIDAELARSERRETPDDCPPLPPLPMARYVDPGFYQLEQTHVFGKSWLYAAMESQLPEIGSYMLWEEAQFPVILVRGRDGKVRAFYNSCRHRGGSLVSAASGKTSAFACNFHCWTYDLDGRLKFVPEEYEFPRLDKKAHGLRQLRCESFGNMIFVNRDPAAVPLRDYIGELGDELDHFDFHRRIYVDTLYYDLDCNWKIALDAFAESYHIFKTHATTVAPMMDSRAGVTKMWQGGHSYMITPFRRGGAVYYDRGDTGDPRHEITRNENQSATLFPNMELFLMEESMSLLNFWPRGVDKTRFEGVVITLGDEITPARREQADQLIEQLSIVFPEDISNMSAVQRSAETGMLASAQLGCLEKRLYQFNEEIDRKIGVENIPEHLRVEQVLGPYLL